MPELEEYCDECGRYHPEPATGGAKPRGSRDRRRAERGAEVARV